MKMITLHCSALRAEAQKMYQAGFHAESLAVHAMANKIEYEVVNRTLAAVTKQREEASC